MPTTPAEPGAVRVRPATPEDSRGIGMVQLDSWHTMFPDAGIDAEAYLALFSYDERTEDWRELLNALEPDQSVFVAELADGTIAGFATGNRESDPGAGYAAELAVVHVLPECRSRSIGRQLIHMVVDQLAQAGYPSLWLWTLKGNVRARALYERLDGQLIREQTKMVGKDEIGMEITEVAYGWPQIDALRRALNSF